MFDPFGDFWQEGYLRNTAKEKNAKIVKRIEHDLLETNLPKSIDYLGSLKRQFIYDDFLEVHKILFAEWYPWAGQDRAMVAPDMVITKGETVFAHPSEIRLAVQAGLRLAQDDNRIRKKPGEVMGLFAYGHPFLDGNGRAMILVHSALCKRAGFSIAWGNLNKSDYLDALSDEIETPGRGVLDSYLLQYKKDDSVF